MTSVSFAAPLLTPPFFSPPHPIRNAIARNRKTFRMCALRTWSPLLAGSSRLRGGSTFKYDAGLMRRLTLLFVWVILAPIAAASEQKVIVLGFDGVDARYTERWMNEGKLPNLAKLRAAGTFRPLRPTIPAQTPVSWSTFSTGIDPGRTGIFDFLRRDPKTYLPLFAAFDETKEPLLWGDRNAGAAAPIVFAVIGLISLIFRGRARIVILIIAALANIATFAAVRKYIPTTRPGVINRRQGTPFWEVAANAGRKTRVVQIPVTFPA